MPPSPRRGQVTAATIAFVGVVLLLTCGGTSARLTTVGYGSVAESAPAGWRLVASDDFTGSALGPQWGAYSSAYAAGTNAWSPDDVSVSGGLLHVKMERRTTAGKPYTAGGAAMWGFAQTYGRYEFKAKAPATPGIDSYITLWPPDSDSDTDATLVELLAKPAVAPGQEAAYVTIGNGVGKSTATVPGRYTDAFHDYVIEWTPDHESVSVDGTELLRSLRVTKARRWIGFIMSNGDTLTGVPDASAALPAEFLIGSLRVYAYAPGSGSVTTGTSSPSKTSPSRSPSVSVSSRASTSASATVTVTATRPSDSASSVTPSAVASKDVAASRTSSSRTPILAVVVVILVLCAAGAAVLLRRRSGGHRHARH